MLDFDRQNHKPRFEEDTMSKLRVLFGFMTLILLVSFSALSQDASVSSDNSRRSMGDAGGGRGTPGNGGGMSSGASISSRSAPMGGIDYSRGSRGYSAGPTSIGADGSNAGFTSKAPNLHGTSFSNLDSFYNWQNYYWRMRSTYMLNGLYFNRFYRNAEPLVTPELMKLTLRGPLTLSTQMLTAVDQLQVMVTDLQGGKQVAREDLTAKTQEIRDLAPKNTPGRVADLRRPAS